MKQYVSFIFQNENYIAATPESPGRLPILESYTDDPGEQSAPLNPKFDNSKIIVEIGDFGS